MQDGDLVVGHESMAWLGWETIRLPIAMSVSRLRGAAGVAFEALWLLTCCATRVQSALLHLQQFTNSTLSSTFQAALVSYMPEAEGHASNHIRRLKFDCSKQTSVNGSHWQSNWTTPNQLARYSPHQ